MRNKEIYCQKCGGRSTVTANLDAGKIESVALSDTCIFPNQCPNQFVEGVFDRPFGERVIRPKIGGFEG